MKLSLETLTPTHIGCGETYSPYSDFIYDIEEKALHILDFQRIIQDFGEKVWIDQYVNQVKQKQNEYSLIKLIDELGKLYEDFYFEDYIIKSLSLNESPKAQGINRTLHSAGNPFIPGSSLKGAIRTALYWCENKNETLFFKNKDTGQSLFGSFGDDQMKYLLVSDTDLIQEPTRIELIKMKNLKKEAGQQQQQLPMNFEMIPSKAKTSFKLVCKGGNDLKFDLAFLKKGQEKTILQKVNDFYTHRAKREIQFLKHYPQYAPTLKFYNKILDTALNYTQSGKGAIVRLGAGKTFWENTVADLLSDQDFSKLKIIKNKIGAQKSTFPATRKWIESPDGFIPAGWVKIEIAE